MAEKKSLIAMINECKPTPRSRHFDIRHFAIQQWADPCEIVTHHIDGVSNPSDAGTKALAILAAKSFANFRPGGAKVVGGAVILEKGLTATAARGLGSSWAKLRVKPSTANLLAQ